MTTLTKTKDQDRQSEDSQKPSENHSHRGGAQASTAARVKELPIKSERKPKQADTNQEKEPRPEPKRRAKKPKHPYPTPRLSISKEGLKRLHLVAVAYSDVERKYFPTEEAYIAEKEVVGRAAEVLKVMEAHGIPARLYEADEHFLTDLIVDRPDLVLNLVDTLRGSDALQTSVPGALEMVDIPYTGADMRGLVIGNDRNLFKQILVANNLPTPDYQFIPRAGIKIREDLGLPLIVKLNESGGSVGIDNNAVKETVKEAQEQVITLIDTYHVPVIVERFIDGPEITVVVFEDSRKKHVFMGKKRFGGKPDGKHEFTSLESYNDANSYTYDPVTDESLASKIEQYVTKAFTVLHNKDYAKYDIRVDEATGTPYFTDCNPNTAFGPHIGLPFTEIIETLYGLKFEKVLEALISKYAKKIKIDR